MTDRDEIARLLREHVLRLETELAETRAHLTALVKEVRPLIEREDERHRLWAIIGTVAFNRLAALLQMKPPPGSSEKGE